MPIDCCVVNCVKPTTSVEITLGSSSLKTSIYPGLTNAFACANLPIHDDRVFDFSEDKSSSLGLVDADMHVGTTESWDHTMDHESCLFCL